MARCPKVKEVFSENAIIYCSSDWHCQPGQLTSNVHNFILKAKEKNGLMIGVGDLFDLVPHKWDKYRIPQKDGRSYEFSPAVTEFGDLLGEARFIYVAGNHDPEPWVRKVFGHMSNVEIYHHFTFQMQKPQSENAKRHKPEEKLPPFHCTHGHRWSIDWSWLQWIIPALVKLSPRAARRISEWIGWLPSKYKPKVDSPRERQRYNDLTGKIWRGALKFAARCECCVILGHTHTGFLGVRYLRSTQPEWEIFADDGDLSDGTVVKVEKGRVELTSVAEMG